MIICHCSAHPYQHGSLELIEHVLSHVTSSDDSDWPDNQQAVVALLKNYQSLLEDHIQAQTLEELRLGEQVCCCVEKEDIACQLST